MRLIDADALIDTLINVSNNDQFKFFPIWIEKQIGAQPTVYIPKEKDSCKQEHNEMNGRVEKIANRTYFMGMSDAEEIARFLMDHAREQKVSVTLTVEPGRTEVSVQPWESVVMFCPYRKE